MTIEVKVPPLPESVSDATLVSWHKKPGDFVKRDENLVDLETDKVVLEVPAPTSGTLQSLAVENGATVMGGDLLAVLEPGEQQVEEDATVVSESVPTEVNQVIPEATQAAADDQAQDAGEGKTGPAARRLIEEYGLEADAIHGSGRDGRVTKADVMHHIDQRGGGTTVLAPDHLAIPAQTPTAQVESSAEERVPMSRLRTRIAERMVEAQHTAAMLTSFNEIDLSEVNALRSKYKDKFEKEHGVRLGFMSFFAKAAVEALKRYPIVNASIEDNDIVFHHNYDIGVAVSTERGLMVPVVRSVDRLSFADVEKAIRGYAGQARDGKIQLSDLSGGTFTITNGGVFGSLISTPILNMPQSAILGMHKIQDRPVAINGEVVIRPMMYIALTYDHRIIDGRDAVMFLVAIKEALEDPARLMLQV